MQIDEAEYWWKFSQPLAEGCEILCPECHEWAPLRYWRETEVGCETCGEHAAMQCPMCGLPFDHVWGPTFQVRPAQQKAPAERPPGPDGC